MFLHGEILDHTFDIEPEPLSVLAEILIDGSTLELRDVAVYCGRGDQRVPVGVGELFRLRSLLDDLARQSGYDILVLTAKRLTGASPNRLVRLRSKLR